MNDNVFKEKISSVMKDNLFDRRIPNQRKGKLDGSALWKVKTQRENVFRQKKERKGKRYNVVFLIDLSGSMGKPGWGRSDKIDICAEACHFLLKVLESNGVNVCVIGYNRRIKIIKKFKEKVKSYFITELVFRANHFRDNSIFAESVLGERDYDFHDGSLSCNHDFDALKTAYEELGKQKGKGILIVFSDGMPNCDNPSICGYNQNKHKTDELKKLIRSNSKVVTIGMGIDCKSVENIYANHIVCNDPGSVSNLFLEKIKGNIINILNKHIKRC